MAIPAPESMILKFVEKGNNHISPYTGSSISRVIYSERPLLKVTYSWNTVSHEKASQIRAGIMNNGWGIATWDMFIKNNYKCPTVDDVYGSAVVSRNGNVLRLNSSLFSSDNLLPGDYIQIGRYCLEVIGKQNIPASSDVNVLLRNIPLDYNFGNTEIFKINRQYSIQAVNEEYMVGYTASVATNYPTGVLPDSVTFTEVY